MAFEGTGAQKSIWKAILPAVIFTRNPPTERYEKRSDQLKCYFPAFSNGGQC